MSIIDDTKDYETWLRRHCTVVDDDLDTKHDRMRKDPFVFLRATYYRWARRIETIAPDIADAPAALCVGDIHLENFGTWRDADGRWVWGVNDFDEAAVMPYVFDLVRLTTSAELAPKMAVDSSDAADAILDGYRAGLQTPRPALLDEHEIWIRSYVKCSDRCRREFWDEIDELEPARSLPGAVRELLVGSLPGEANDATFRRRVAGGGGLGRPRFVIVATWRGGRVVREAKALVPSAWTWKSNPQQRSVPPHQFVAVSTGAHRAPDPFLNVHRTGEGDYLVRRLSADSRKIDLGKDAGADLKRDLLRAMGTDLASIHAATHGDAVANITADLKRRGSGWLHKAARAARKATEKDYEVWCRKA
ncbi:hypothetical protein SSBR45G_35070 [Bradyrhizobium sp. SSBR45G]|uniref:DUF2252 family protein n=1 Tax=unclassified Bradyrhizobium TaxID=2631580 RepID=UPI002342B9BF|nr:MULTISPECIES: DUF2252 family protein [unclassified Bradyrhizobium]GLH78598.1 hypothetical protein SSBR45G_35070 [Bradyrhizobium sp. SSBR45G]GLH86382.1 hypothetical protein SSBR45R_38420 [Bradyrhizobium sp. SSBR45R]